MMRTDLLIQPVAIGQGEIVLNLKKNRLGLDIQNKFFTVRVVKHWNRLPREVEDAPYLEMFKVRLDGVLSDLI